MKKKSMCEKAFKKKIDHKRFGIKLDEYLAYLDTVIEQWMFTPEAKEMAKEALNQAKDEVLLLIF